ncbi:MAG: DUF1365 domain-containing protein [Planctomycetota bacterium]
MPKSESTHRKPTHIDSYASAIYEGTVRHRRNLPKIHQFDFQFFMLLLDLDEISSIFKNSWFWSTRKWCLCRFNEAEHVKKYRELSTSGTPNQLRDRVEIAVREMGVEQPIGSIRVLTQLSYFGFAMNPVSFYYCYSPDGSQMVAVLAEVNNTPWGEQHLYLVPATEAKPSKTIRSGDIDKVFHVSPFMNQEMQYRMAFTAPDSSLAVKIENHLTSDHELAQSPESPGKIMDVTLSLKRKPWSLQRLNWLLLKYPAISFRVFAGIYWNALLLYLKKIPFVPHPNKTKSSAHSETEIEEQSPTQNDSLAEVTIYP